MAATSLGAAFLCYVFRDAAGLAGATAGVVFAALLSAVSHLVTERVRRTAPRLLPASMLLGVGASFLLMVIFILALAAIRRDLVIPASLTAVAVYLIYRFFEAFEVSRAVREGTGVDRPAFPVRPSVRKGTGP